MRKIRHWAALSLLITLGLLLLMAEPSETTTGGQFAMVMIATKGGCLACFAAAVRLMKRMEKDGDLTVGE